MKIKRLQVQNFKGFRDTGWLELADGFNIVVGQNNSGKSALLEAFRLSRGKDDPFRSEEASEPHEVAERSTFNLDVSVRWKEWVEGMAVGPNDAWFPTVTSEDLDDAQHLLRISGYLAEQVYALSGGPGTEYQSRVIPAYGNAAPSTKSIRAAITANKQGLEARGQQGGHHENFGSIFKHIEPRRIVLLAAQKATSESSGISPEIYLTHNASNLPTR